MTITLRPAQPEDDTFLLEVYASTRAEELDLVDWSAAERQAFVHMQYDAQRSHYQARFPESTQSIIQLDGMPIGRIYMARQPHEIRLLDLTILPFYRNRGIGTALFKTFIEEADRSGLPLRYMVLQTNHQAIRLYRRLGFDIVEEVGGHFLMEHAAQTASDPAQDRPS